MPEVNSVGSYTVTHHRSNENNVVIVFASAGRDGMGQPIEEFKNTLKSFNISMIFILDPTPTWFNRPETNEMFKFVASLASRYENVAVLGESMGASGSLIFSKFFDGITRVLAFAPQYSVSKPFIQFDERFQHAHENYEFSNFWTFTSNLSRDRVQILCGISEWRDMPHVAMYAAEGYSVNYLLECGHLVGYFLKTQPDVKHGNKLKALLAAFLNFDVQFTRSEVRMILEGIISDSPICQVQGFAAIRERETFLKKGYSPILLPPPPTGVSLTLNGTPDQSSVSPWSKSSVTTIDAAGAINDSLENAFGFHTDAEEEPWWSIKFSGPAKVQEVRIYNRIDDYGTSTRGLQFCIELMTNGDWREIYRKNDMSFFGGIDGTPFVLKLSEVIISEGLRVKLLRYKYMHFQKIEIFGDFVEKPVIRTSSSHISKILKKRLSFPLLKNED
ncbi:hypothetical protein GS501_09085 [Saccharibacter sp. 17.LH.SD]|uniref:hypothetical protein n=1 Tax=Saccharibacter sp. 17.LH.SD TaxID=2689393 RepID=UPI001368A93B|nr:hypothetical protein [Saccharibacter sp. 17.LH.SD]MXV45185.1 hypothetical protein [Saccharibacter sp. 17.LH.SD]